MIKRKENYNFTQPLSSCSLHRLIRNPLGSAHPEATLKACLEHGAPDDAIQVAQAEFHAHLAANRSQQAAASHDLVEDSELLVEDRELDSDTQGDFFFYEHYQHPFATSLTHSYDLNFCGLKRRTL